MTNLVLLSASSQAPQDQRFLRFAEWMGVSAKAVPIQDGGAFEERLVDDLQSGPCCLAMSADTLVVLHKALTSATDLRQFTSESCAKLLVFGCSGSTAQNIALSWLTAGAVCGISQAEGPDAFFSLPRESVALSLQLAGLNFSRRNREPIPVFDLRDATPAPEVIVAASNRPMFVRIDRSPLHVFLLAGPALLDLDEPLSRDQELQDHYDCLIPVQIFLRHCFGSSAGTGRNPPLDSLLTIRYSLNDTVFWTTVFC